jgi:hypothetical protein
MAVSRRKAILSQAAADAVEEIVGDTEIEIDRDDAIVIANELLEKFTSPLMIQRAAGASLRFQSR